MIRMEFATTNFPEQLGAQADMEHLLKEEQGRQVYNIETALRDPTLNPKPI